MGTWVSLLLTGEQNSSTVREPESRMSVFLQSLCQQSLTAALINFAQSIDLNLLAVYMARVRVSIH